MTTDKWWSTWAPFLDQFENRHFSTFVTDQIISDIEPDVLVIGAGQGLIVRHLLKKNINTEGLDINKDMLKLAKEKYDLDLIHGDAQALPFQKEKYKTIILSSGVVDYGADNEQILKIIAEAKRVCSKAGNLFIAFYKLLPPIEKMYRRLGIIFKNYYYMKRIFIFDQYVRRSMIKTLKPLKEWTGNNTLKVLIDFTLVGLTLPKEIKTERSKFADIFKQAAEMGITEDMMVDCIPEKIPYRTTEDVKELLNFLKIKYTRCYDFADCTVIQIKKI